MSIKAISCATHHYQLSETLDVAWNHLATTREVNESLVRAEIARSWERCLAVDLDPRNCDKSRQASDIKEKLAENRLLVKAAVRHLSRLSEILPDSGFIVMLAAVDGALLSVTGDRKMMAHAESLYLHPGVGILEGSIGTTALGISLVSYLPAQVLLNEHFFQGYHDWCCSSSPIFDREGNLLGVVNAANRSLTGHPPQVLTMVKMTAEAIQAELWYARLHEEHKRTSLYFMAAFEASPDPLIFFDREDNLAYINQRAQNFLGPDASELVGRYADSVIQNYDRVKNNLIGSPGWVDLEFRARDRRITVEARLNQIRLGGDQDRSREAFDQTDQPPDEAGEAYGIIGTLRPKPGGRREAAEEEGDLRYDFRDFIYSSQVMDRLIRQAKKMALTDHTLLIEGESGTGKEILAQAIHQAGSRREQPFVAVNCAALPRELIQSELFGYENGSFTGADKGGKPGKFEHAQGGTLFLDEIGDMPLEAQANLLRVLQEKRVVRIGGSKARRLDLRIISATNKDLLKESREGNFRSDLYYRLAVINLQIPPLRERPEDIWPLARHFARKHRSADGAEELRFSPKVQARLREYVWPGNVRELESLIIYLLNEAGGQMIQPRDLPDYFRSPARPDEDSACDLETVERQAIHSALRQCDGNISRAAKLLSISRATVYKKMRKYNLLRPGD